MDIKEYMRAGGFIHQNPAYNPKSKKNTVPKYITNENPVGALNGASAAADFLMAHQEGLMNLDYLGDPEKYARYGVTVSPVGNLEKELADAQSNWSKVGNALAQTLVSEVGLGTFRGMSDLLDAVGQAVGVSDHDYSNPVSQYLEGLQKEFEENVAPIYSDPERNTILEGGLGNVGWWASNFPSIASSLTLLLPAAGVTKGLSALGKIGKGKSLFALTSKGVSSFAKGIERAGAKDLAKWMVSPTTKQGANLMVENALTGALSRTMENYQESRQVYSDVYNEGKNTLINMSDKDYKAFLDRNGADLQNAGVDINDKDAVAKYIAQESADRTFTMDWANVVFDAYQMYALRNVFAHAPKFHSNTATRFESRLARMFPDKSREEALKLYKEKPWIQRALNRVGDYTIGMGTQIKASASEGIEEGINFIAQQEGTHLGKYLLTGEGEDDKSTGIFGSYANAGDRIINDYVANSQLWDSAFWGVLGGVVFEGLGSKFNQLKQTIENRDKAKDKEGIEKPAWWQFDNTNETQRMINEIQSRSGKFQAYKQIVEKIKSGHNPYIEGKESKDDYLTPTEQEVLLDKATTEYIDGMVVDARNNGTLDDLKAYMKSEEVRNAFIENGLVSREEADKFMANFSARADKVDAMYDDEIRHLDRMAADVYRKTNLALPVEYLQIIASDNVRHRLNIESLNDIEATYQNIVNKAKALLEGKLDRDVNYEDLVKLKTVASSLSALRVKQKELQKAQKENPSIFRQIELDDVDKQIKTIMNNIVKGDLQLSEGATLYATLVSDLAFRSADNGKIGYNSKKVVEQLDALIINGLDDLYNLAGLTKPENTDATIGDIKRYISDISKVIGEDSELAEMVIKKPDGTKENVGSELADAYSILASIQMSRYAEQSQLNETEDEMTRRVKEIHNINQEGRRAAINEATTTIMDLQDKYEDVDLTNVIDSSIAGINEAALASYSEEDKTKLKNAIKVLDLGSRTNQGLFQDVIQTLIVHKLTKAGTDATAADASRNESPESSTSQENPLESTQQSSVDNTSENGSEANTGQISGQNEPQPSKTIRAKIKPQLNGSSIITPSNDADSLTLREVSQNGDEHTYEIDANPNDNITHDETYFDITATGDNTIITKKPRITATSDGQITAIEKGVVADKPSSTSSTGGVQEGRINNTDEIDPNDGFAPEGRGQAYDDPRVVISVKVRDFFAAHKDEVKAGKSFTLEEIKDFINDEELLKNIENADKLIQQEYNAWTTNFNQVFPDVVRPLMDVLSSNIIEGYDKNKKRKSRFARMYNTSFKNALKALVSEYARTAGLAQVDGKYLVNVESLLRYANGEVKDNINARILYAALSEYMTSDEAKQDYIIVDENHLRSEDFLRDVAKTEDERKIAVFSDRGNRINIFDFINGLNEKEKEDYYKYFDTIQLGDDLTFEKSGKFRIYIKHNGHIIGYIGTPSYKGNIPVMLMHGWEVDCIGKNASGSTFKQAIINLIDNDSDNAKDFKDNLIKLAFENLNATQKNDIIKKIVSNPEFDKLRGYLHENADIDEAVVGLANLWEYCYQLGSITNPKETLKESLDNWFAKVNDSASLGEYLSTNKNAQITVQDVNPGNIIPAVKLTEIQNETEIPLASEAIAKNSKGRVRLAISSSSTPGYFNTSSSDEIVPLVQGLNVPRGATFAVIPAGNGVNRFAQVRSRLWSDLVTNPNRVISKILQAVDKAIKDEIETACVEGDVNNLIKLLDNLFAYSSGRTPMFYCNYGDVTVGAGRFIGKGKFRNQLVNGQDLKIFINPGKRAALQIGKNTPVSFTIDNADSIKDLLLRRIHEVARFIIGYQQLAGDNGRVGNYNELMYHDARTGEFVIKIGGEELVRTKSFNDFVMDNDVVRINMKPADNGTNITRNADNAFVERPRLKIAAKTPVEERTDTRPVTHTVVESREEQVINIINDPNVTNKGEEIAKIIVGRKTLNSLILNNLLPGNIVYDDTLESNAQMEIGSDVIRVGKKFLELVRNDPQQAIRKLIHERVHQIIHTDNNLKYRDKLVDVYKEFLNKVNNELKSYTFTNKYVTFADEESKVVFEKVHGPIILNEEGKAINIALEEFLVESLTSKELMNFLNNTESDVKESVNTRKKKSLFQKILKVLADILGIKINNDTLFAREYNALADIIDSTPKKKAKLSKQTSNDTQTEFEFTEEEAAPAVESRKVTEDTSEEDIDDDVLMFSDITEGNPNDVSSIEGYLEAQPIEIQASQASYIEQGAFKISCR